MHAASLSSAQGRHGHPTSCRPVPSLAQMFSLHPTNFTSTWEGTKGLPQKRHSLNWRRCQPFSFGLCGTSCDRRGWADTDSRTAHPETEMRTGRRLDRQRGAAQAGEEDIPQRGRDPQGAAESRGKRAREPGEGPAVRGWDGTRRSASCCLGKNTADLERGRGEGNGEGVPVRPQPPALRPPTFQAHLQGGGGRSQGLRLSPAFTEVFHSVARAREPWGWGWRVVVLPSRSSGPP